MRLLALAVFALCVSIMNPNRAAAQLSELQPGARVRVVAPGVVAGRYEGTILTRSSDTLVVGAPNATPIRVPLSRITSLEVSRGKSRADGAVAGIKWGAPIMAAIAASLVITTLANDCKTCSPLSADKAVSAIASLTLGGALYGAGIGALIGREHWDQFDLAQRTSLRIERGRIGVGMQFGF